MLDSNQMYEMAVITYCKKLLVLIRLKLFFQLLGTELIFWCQSEDETFNEMKRVDLNQLQLIVIIKELLKLILKSIILLI